MIKILYVIIIIKMEKFDMRVAIENHNFIRMYDNVSSKDFIFDCIMKIVPT